MSNWILMSSPPREIKALEDLPGYETLVGFVYIIRHRETQKIYVGKKVLYHATKKKASLKEKAAAKSLNARSNIKIVRGKKESDWKKYWGSCQELKDDVKKYGPEAFNREIVDLACTRKYLGFSELEQMIKHDVLRRDSYNGNIGGSIFRRDMENCINLKDDGGGETVRESSGTA